MKIIKPSIRHWIVGVGAWGVFIFVAPIVGIYIWEERFYWIAVLCFLFGIYRIIVGVKKGVNNQIIFQATGIECSFGKEDLSIRWEDIEAIQVIDQSYEKLIMIYTDQEEIGITHPFFNKKEVLQQLNQYVSPDKFSPQALQPLLQEYYKALNREFANLPQPLKVSHLGFEKFFGIVALLGGVGCAALFYFWNNLDTALFFGPLFGGLGLILIIISLGSIEATNQEIKYRSPIRQISMRWEDIRQIYINSDNGLLALVSDEGRLVLKPGSWTGKNKEQILRLLVYKLEILGIEPKESIKISFWYSKMKRT